MPSNELTAKQGRFVAEYVIDFNATQAAIRAGYSEDTAPQQASRLLTNVNVAAAVEVAKAQVAKKTEITAERVLGELAKIGFMDIRRLFDEDGNLRPVTQLPDDVAAAVSAIEVVNRNGQTVHKIKLLDKRAALVDLARHLGLFPSKVEVTGQDGEPLVPRDSAVTLEVARRLAFLLHQADDSVQTTH